MGLTTRWVAGLLMVLIGAVWTLQGFGVAGGGAGSTWLVVGLVLVVAGVAVLARRPTRRP